MTAFSPDEERPVDLDEVPDSENISQADAAERIDSDPEDEVNYTDGSAETLAGEPTDSAPDPGEDT